jgi:hypothetical protein
MLIALVAGLTNSSAWVSTACFLGTGALVLVALFLARGRPIQLLNEGRGSRLGTVMIVMLVASGAAATIAAR